jgi:hypothetical protein
MPVIQIPNRLRITRASYLQHAVTPARRRRKWPLALLALALVGTFIFHSIVGHALADMPQLVSGVNGLCLDDFHNDTSTKAVVDVWKCNASAAQNWAVATTAITHESRCLTVQAGGKTARSVRLRNCSDETGQVWLRTKAGFFNPGSGLCLQTAGRQNGDLVRADSCGALGTGQGIWKPTNSDGNAIAQPACGNTRGEKVACAAEKEWAMWQTGDHEALLTSYTGGTPYEAWCADFVSYVYREAGYPFTRADGGWNENVADDVQNHGFTRHEAGSGYVPKPGDVAYFNYNGGHVEIVVSAGKTPTFIYGNSGQNDPATGNGQMAANTITDDGDNGRVIYYLSPR